MTSVQAGEKGRQTGVCAFRPMHQDETQRHAADGDETRRHARRKHGPQRARSRGRVRGNALSSRPFGSLAVQKRGSGALSVATAGLQRGPCPGCRGGGQG